MNDDNHEDDGEECDISYKDDVNDDGDDDDDNDDDEDCDI